MTGKEYKKNFLVFNFFFDPMRLAQDQQKQKKKESETKAPLEYTENRNLICLRAFARDITFHTGYYKLV